MHDKVRNRGASASRREAVTVSGSFLLGETRYVTASLSSHTFFTWRSYRDSSSQQQLLILRWRPPVPQSLLVAQTAHALYPATPTPYEGLQPRSCCHASAAVLVSAPGQHAPGMPHV